MKQGLLLFLLIGSVSINFLLGYKFLQKDSETKVEYNSPQEESSSPYPFLSKRIFTENPNDIFISFYPLRSALNEYVGGIGSSLKVYFEYLPSGNSIGINEKDELAMASLVKVPTVMTIYKKIENGELQFDDILTLKKDSIDKGFGSLWQKGEGTKINIKDAIFKTLAESDNTAHNMLYDLLSESEKQTVYSNFDIGIPDDSSVPTISAKSYTSILRALYLSSFITKKSSNEILEILTESKFTDGITKNIPSNIKVAHKFGVYEKDNQKIFVYSDCGITFIPKRPYILCVMYEGNAQEASKHMQLVSKMVFEYISKVN